jgi:hypothetical protein
LWSNTSGSSTGNNGSIFGQRKSFTNNSSATLNSFAVPTSNSYSLTQALNTTL